MIPVGMSTTCVYPRGTEQAFRLAALAGFDGVEIMVTGEGATKSAAALRRLSARYELPILSVHAPVLLLSQLVWGLDNRVKLARAAELARDVGASTVVAHPPFRWQPRHAAGFPDAVREIGRAAGVEIAVENMFPVRLAGRERDVFSPGWDPTGAGYDAMTLDFSHAALGDRDSLALATAMGSRLRHVHLCDGSAPAGNPARADEHLLPGTGGQPVAEVLRRLAAGGFAGSVIAEITTRRSPDDDDRLARLRETVEFARAHLVAVPAPLHQDL